jgi:nucleoside-diphosphate-sugar epimerase
LKAKKALGYQPKFNILEGIDKAMPWYALKLGRK